MKITREQAMARAAQLGTTGAWQDAGKYFGFPQCCIDQFCTDCCHDTKEQYDFRAPWDGSGYVPCLTCAAVAVKDFPAFLATHINPSRHPNADPFGPGAR